MTAGLTLKFSLGVKKATIRSLKHMSPPQEIDPNRYPVSQSSLRESPFAATNSTCQDTERTSLISDASYPLFLFCSFLSQQHQQGQLQLSDQRALWKISSQFIMQLCPTGQLKFLGGLLHGCQIGKCWSSKTQQGPKNSDFVWTKSKQIPVSHVYSKHEAPASSHNLITILRTDWNS